MRHADCIRQGSSNHDRLLIMKAAREDQLDDRYDHLHDQVSAEFKSKHASDWPEDKYRPNHARIHKEVMARMAEIEAE